MVIRVEGIEKVFNGRRVLKGISFRVKKGEVFGYLGPNGAGKTTTVRILTCILKPDGGKAYVCGYDVVKEPIKVKERIGVIPEVANVYPDLTVLQNVMLASQLYGVDKRVARSKCERLLKEFDIYGKRDAKARQLSKGLRQRLMLCMALISDPELIFLDEPTSGLDVASARMLRRKIIELRDTGVTIFLTSHNMDEVDMLCDRVAIIKDGTIIAEDSPDGIKELVGGDIAVEVKFDRDVAFFGERVGDRYVIYTKDPNETICKVVDFAKEKGVRIVSINTRTPTLEEAFMKILGEGV